MDLIIIWDGEDCYTVFSTEDCEPVQDFRSRDAAEEYIKEKTWKK